MLTVRMEMHREDLREFFCRGLDLTPISERPYLAIAPDLQVWDLRDWSKTQVLSEFEVNNTRLILASQGEKVRVDVGRGRYGDPPKGKYWKKDEEDPQDSSVVQRKPKFSMTSREYREGLHLLRRINENSKNWKRIIAK